MASAACKDDERLVSIITSSLIDRTIDSSRLSISRHVSQSRHVTFDANLHEYQFFRQYLHPYVNKYLQKRGRRGRGGGGEWNT